MVSAAAAALVAGAGYSASAATSAAPGSNAQTTSIEEVVVTAQRRSENAQNVPVSVQAISATQLQKQGIKTSSDLGQITPNVTISLPNGEGNQPSITIRGIGLNDFDTNNAGPNGVYVDDVYISTPAMQTFALFDVDQIQVLKGPQGTLYGRNTSGGAVVVNTARPTDYLTGAFHTEYSSFGTYQVSGALGGPIVEGLDGRVSFVVNHSNGFAQNQLTGAPASGIDNQAVRLQLLYKPTDNLKILFSSTIGAVNNGVTQYRHIGTFVPGTQKNATPDMCSVAQAYANACVDLFGVGTNPNFYAGRWRDTGNLKVNNNIEFLRADYTKGPWTLTSISAYEGNSKYYPENTSASDVDVLSATGGVNSQTLTQEVRAAYSQNDLHVVGGVYYLHETLNQNQPLSLFADGDLYGGLGITEPKPGSFDGIAQLEQDHGKQVTNSVAVFGQGDYTWENLTLTLGGRFTYEDKSFDYAQSDQFQEGGLGHYGAPGDFINAHVSASASNFTWRAALAYHFTKDLMGYASAATGFKAGGFNGGYLSNDPVQVAFQLTPIRPEHVTAYEVGFKGSFFDRRLVADAAAFYNDYQDEQIFLNLPQTIETGAGPVTEITNVLANAKKAHTEGVELAFTAAPLPGLTITAQPAWLQTRIDDAGVPTFTNSVPLNGKQLVSAPHFSFYGAVDYSFPVRDGDKVDLEISASYKSHQYFDTTNDPYTTQAGYWIANANVSYTFQNRWTVNAFVRNLSGTKYLTYAFDLSSPFGFVQGYLGAPRTFGAGASYKF